MQTSLAKVLFAQDVTLMGRLTDIDERIKKDGLDVLASADAKGFRALSRAPPTFDDMDAGTFARALSAEAGRKGGAKGGARMAAMTEEDRLAHHQVSKAGGACHADMTEEDRLAHAQKIKAGGGCHAAMTEEDRVAHDQVTKAGGGCHAAMTEEDRVAHAQACKAGGADHADMTEEEKRAHTQLRQMGRAIGHYRREKSEGSPVKVLRVLFNIAGKTISHYTSRDASLDNFNAICVSITPSSNKDLFDIISTVKGDDASGISVVLPLSHEADCEGVPIWKQKRAGRCWDRGVFSALKAKGVKWSAEDDVINDDVVAEFDAAKKASKTKKNSERQSRKRKRKALSTPSATGV